MKTKLLYGAIGLVIGVLITAGITLSAQAYAKKKEADEQFNYSGAKPIKMSELPKDEPHLKSMEDRFKDVRNEFNSGKAKIDEKESADKNIANIEKQIKFFEKHNTIKQGRTDVIDGYQTALADLKEANEKVKKGEHINQSIFDDMQYNLMETHRTITKMEQSAERHMKENK